MSLMKVRRSSPVASSCAFGPNSRAMSSRNSGVFSRSSALRQNSGRENFMFASLAVVSQLSVTSQTPSPSASLAASTGHGSQASP